MLTCIHQLPQWPTFRWDAAAVTTCLASVRHQQGRLAGRMESLGFPQREEALLATLTQDILKSSEIEGEFLDLEQVRSSLARRLGMDIGGLAPSDRHVEGIVELMLDATQNHTHPLTQERLLRWHAALFPTGWSGMSRIAVGAWRTGPMQVVSGPLGRERVHYEAPAAERLEAELRLFLTWFAEDSALDGVLRAALAHLWFVSIHPFDDGNGRIARALTDLSLARSEQSPQRFYSMSAQIQKERSAYYDILEATQKGDLDITEWLFWFFACLGRAIEGAEVTLSQVLRKAHFWENYQHQPFNERQRKVLNQLLTEFEGKLTSSKWARLTKTSPDTALRDITDLVARGILVRDTAGGRSTHYVLDW